MALIANCNRSSKHRPDPYIPSDFLPDSMKPEEKVATLSEIKQMLNSVANQPAQN